MNFYQLLGVGRNATPEEIAKAYRKKAAILHPDVNPSGQAIEDFKRLNEAYQTLSDPSKRAIYNSKNPDVITPVGKTGRKPRKEPVGRNDPNFGKSTIIDVPQKNGDIWEDIKQEMDSWEKRTSQPKQQVWEDWEWKGDKEKPKPVYTKRKTVFSEDVFSDSKDPNLGKHTIFDVPEKKNDLNSRKEEHFKDSVRYTNEDSPELR